jgi:hypothetical protein
VLLTDQPTDFRRLSTVLTAFGVKLEPVLDVGNVVAAEAAAIAWRDGLSVR